METKVVGGQDTWWKVLEGAWVVGMHGSEFRCCTECNNLAQLKDERSTVKNIQMQNIGGKSQEYLNYSIDILKWKMFRIYKLFPAYSVPEK